MVRRWSYTLMDSNDLDLGTLDGVRKNGGRADVVAQSPLGGSGRLLLDRRGQDIDWMSNRLRVNFHDGPKSWPVGTYLLSSPVERHTGSTLTWEVGLLTKMSVINEDTTAGRIALPAGTAIIPQVVSLIQSTGETRIAATDSGAVLAGPLTWESGTSKLKIINILLEAAGYWALRCDGSGLFRVEPYVDPKLRPVAHEFTHGATSLHMPDWSRAQDNTSVPNRIELRTEGDGDSAGLRGVATNTDPASPYSFQSRGDRWIGPEAEVVEAASQAVIDQLAARKLRDAMTPVSRLNVDHAMLDLHMHDLVAFTPEDGRRRLATVQRMSMDFRYDTLVSAEWREVL